MEESHATILVQGIPADEKGTQSVPTVRVEECDETSKVIDEREDSNERDHDEEKDVATEDCDSIRLEESEEEEPQTQVVPDTGCLGFSSCFGANQDEKAASEEPEKASDAKLQDVYLPDWLHWIDPTRQPESENKSLTSSNEIENSVDGHGDNMDKGVEDISPVILKTGSKANDIVATLSQDQEEKAALRKKLVGDLRVAITSKGRYSVEVADISAQLGDLMLESGEEKQALKLYRDAVSIRSSKLGDDHTSTMEARLGLGKVLESCGQYDEAINTYYLVTVMRRALRGDKDPSAADSLVCIARALRKKTEYALAIKELKRALKIYRESLGDSHPKVSSTVDEIASLYVTLGDFEKSAAILEEVVKLKAATLGMESSQVSEALISLATTYECSEEFDKSMKTLKKAYKIETDIGGYSSEGSTKVLNRIAHLYEAMGDFNRASIAYLGVLRGRKNRLGEEDLAVGEAYYLLGCSLRQTSQPEKALQCMKEALPIYVGKGEELQDVERIAEIMHQMALINKDKKNLKEASRIFKQELGVRRKIGQPEFPTIARTLNHMGVIEFELKNNTHALKHMVEALTIFQKRGEHGIECAEVLFNAGLVFEACSNKKRALDAFQEAARIFREHGYKEDHPHLLKACRKLGKLRSSNIDAEA